jgi:hypothetical protein
VDEVDAKPDADWPYERLLPMLDLSSRGDVRPVFILAGSSGFSLEGMKENISSRSKGADLLSRVPSENEILIPPMSFGDRILVVLSQFLDVAEQSGHDIQAVEKLGLYYIALHPSLNNARQLREFAIRAIERVPRGDDRIKYDHLFTPGDPENKRFWMEVSAVADALINHYIHVEA